MTWGMIRDRIARAVIEVNPEAAIQRRNRPPGSGGWRWSRRFGQRDDRGPGAAAGGGAGRDQMLTARARELRKAGIGGGMDELRVQAYLEKLGVLDPLADVGRAARAPTAAPMTAMPTVAEGTAGLVRRNPSRSPRPARPAARARGQERSRPGSPPGPT